MVLHLVDRLAVLVQGRFAVGSSTGCRIPLVVLHHFLGNLIGDGDTVGEVVRCGTLGVLEAIADGHHGENQQRRDLDDVDHHVDGGGAGHAPEGDVGHAKGEDDAEEPHEQRAVVGAAEGVGPELVQQEPAQDRRHADHDAGIDPVVKVARPAGNELGDTGEFEGMGLGEECLLRIQIRRTRARIDLRQFGIAVRRCEAQQQGEENAEPHGASGHRGAVQGLHLECQPEERARGDQRHRVHRQAGQA